MQKFLRITPLLLAIGVIGCGGSGLKQPEYANVSGAVTYNGKPIEKGTITFASDGRPPTSADIVDGKYSGQAMVGKNKVSITAHRKAAKAREMPATAKKQIEAYRAMNKGGGGGTGDEFDPSMEDYIPEDYGSASKQIREVQATGQNTFDFTIKGK